MIFQYEYYYYFLNSFINNKYYSFSPRIVPTIHGGIICRSKKVSNRIKLDRLSLSSSNLN